MGKVWQGHAHHGPAPAIRLLALAACGPADSDPGPGGVTVSEAKALDEAAAMLDERREAAEAGKAEAVATPSEGEEE